MNRRMESLFAHRIRSEDRLPGKLAIMTETLRSSGGQLESETVEILAAEMKPWAADASAALDSLEETPNTAYLRALLASEADGSATRAWERFFAHHYSYDPFHRAAYARSLAGQGDFSGAARQLQFALSQPVRYAFFPRVEKLIRRVAEHVDWELREARVAVLGTSTTNLLVPVLEALCLRDRIRAEFYQGLYGALEQEVLDPESGLAKFHPDVVFLVNHWRDLALPPVAIDENEIVEQVVGRQKTLWQRLSNQFGCHVVQHAFDFPAEDAYGVLSLSMRGGRARVTEAINRRMREGCPSHVSVLDTPAVQRRTGLERWEDPGLWHSFKQHPATEALPALAEAQQAHLRAVLGLTRKVLVTDLDNTLWKGVIGEDGLQGIQIGPGTAAGEAHQRLQEYMRDLKTRGILLAVCSKNNVEDAKLPFEKHDHTVLRLEDFAAFEANWNDKVQNLRVIAEKLSLGLDSFVFLDDSPIEREWVRSQLPQVAVVELGPSVFHYTRDLDRGQYFFALSVSQEDLARAEQYRTESRREMLRTSAQSLDEFLAQLQLEASVVPVDDSNLARVTQLTNKTNQFNVTTRRYTEAQIRKLTQQEGAWAGAFQLSDRMGSYGLIGLIFCVPGASQEQWEIDTWLMSCRALGRQMERFMFDRMMEAAAAMGVREITGVYLPTAKNGLVADLYEKLGFAKGDATAEEIRWSIAVPKLPANSASHIRDVSPRDENPIMAPAGSR
jgi:FkbH-like protein